MGDASLSVGAVSSISLRKEAGEEDRESALAVRRLVTSGVQVRLPRRRDGDSSVCSRRKKDREGASRVCKFSAVTPGVG